MKKGNVLLIGNSGVGKSTLINAVLGEDRAFTNFGSTGTTKELAIYENEQIPFRLIDTVGFEPSFFKELSAIRSVQKWSKECAKDGKEDNQINVIWFCVDGTSSKLFPKTIDNLIRATKIWPSVPIVTVITKSFSIPDRDKNVKMIQEAFYKNKKDRNFKEIVPVVASIFVVSDTAYAPPYGIAELIDITNKWLPEGIKAGEKDLNNFKLSRKKSFAHSIVAASTVTAAVVGAVPIPIPDSTILVPTELALLKSLSLIYGIKQNDASKDMLNKIVDVGAVSLAAKAALSALKAIPGINLGVSVLNSIVAGSIVAALGEGSIYIFEQIYLGNKSVNDIDWITQILQSKLTNQFLDKISQIPTKLSQNHDSKAIAKIIIDLFISDDRNK